MRYLSTIFCVLILIGTFIIKILLFRITGTAAIVIGTILFIFQRIFYDAGTFSTPTAVNGLFALRRRRRRDINREIRLPFMSQWLQISFCERNAFFAILICIHLVTVPANVIFDSSRLSTCRCLCFKFLHIVFMFCIRFRTNCRSGYFFNVVIIPRIFRS